MNPYPFRRLNHFTVPIFMICPRRPRGSGALRQPSETTHAMAAAMTLEAETSDALAVQRTLPDDALRIAASASRRTARLETKRGCSCDVNRALPAIKNGGGNLSLPPPRPDQARAMACPARARSP